MQPKGSGFRGFGAAETAKASISGCTWQIVAGVAAGMYLKKKDGYKLWHKC
jgi:hypothetical protein